MSKDLTSAFKGQRNRWVTHVPTKPGHGVGMPSSVPASCTANAEEYWPDIDGFDYGDTVTDFALQMATFNG